MTEGPPPSGERPSAHLAGLDPGADGLIRARSLKWALVDRTAIRDNTRAIVDLVGPEVAVMAMVKSNGYGHGLEVAAVAALEGGARRLGVSSPEEALALRALGIDAPVVVVGWSHPAALGALLEADVEVSVVDETSLRAVEEAAAASGRVAAVHLKVDTGMHRLGAAPDLAARLLREIAASRHLRLYGVFTHFADADGERRDTTEAQLERFVPLVSRARDLVPDVVVHAANSAALLRFPESRFDCVRPGILVYGYVPDHCPAPPSIRPAMTVAAWVTQVKVVRDGEAVGYGGTWRARGDRRIAVVAAGYGDGVHRAQSNRGAVLIRGRPCPIVGTVSMDQLTADVTDLDDVAAGDVAILVGGDAGGRRGADVVAASAGTISYEVLCAVSARVPRLVVG